MIDALLYQMTTDMTPFCVFLGHTLGHDSIVYTFRVVTYWHVVSYKLESQYGFDNLLQSHSLARCEPTLSLFVFPQRNGHHSYQLSLQFYTKFLFTMSSQEFDTKDI